MSQQPQNKQANLDNRNRYYNEGRNEGDDDEDEEVNMNAQDYEDQQEIDDDQEEEQQNQINQQIIHNQMYMKKQDPNIMKQMQQNDQDYQEDDNEQFLYNQRQQFQHAFIPDQDNPGGIEKQWFYSFQENSEDNLENVQQISQIPSSQFQSQQQSMQGSQNKIPSYMNQQQFQLKQSSQQQNFQQGIQQRQNQQQQQMQQVTGMYNNFIQSAGDSQQEEDEDEQDSGNIDNQQNQMNVEQMRMMLMMKANLQPQQQFDNVNMEQQNQNIANNINQQGDDQIQLEEQQQQEQVQQEEMIMCNKCLKFPINYIELNCQHSFCLRCMAEWFMEQDYLTIEQIFEQPLSSTDASELKEECTVNVDCVLCAVQTLLDYDSVEAVKEEIRQIQINFIQQQENAQMMQQMQFNNQQQGQQFKNEEDEEEDVESDNIKQQQYQDQQQLYIQQEGDDNMQLQQDEEQYYYEQMNIQNQLKQQQQLLSQSQQSQQQQQQQQQQRSQPNIKNDEEGDNEELVEDSEHYKDQQQDKKQSFKMSPVINVNNFINNNNNTQKLSLDQISQSLQIPSSSNQSQVGNINLQKLQPIIPPSQQSPVLIIQNDSQLNSLQANNRQEIIYEDSSETFQTEETNRNHNNNSNPNTNNNLGGTQTNQRQQQEQQLQLNQQNQTAESKSSSSQQNYSNQNYIRDDSKKVHGKEVNKFINTSNKNYHHVNSQQSFSNNNSPHNNTTPYDTNSMQIFSKKNQDYTSFSNSQYNASMTPQSNSEINFTSKEQQIIHNHAFNDYFSMGDKQSHLISPNSLQQQQQLQSNSLMQNQIADLTHSNYSGASTSHIHEGSTMSDIQKKMMQKTTNESFKSAPDNSKKIVTKSTPIQLSTEKNDGYQLEDVQEHYGEQTDDETEGPNQQIEYKSQLNQHNFSKKNQNIPEKQQLQQQLQFEQENDNVKKELNYDDFANVSDSNLQDEDSFQQQNTLEFNKNPSLRDSQKQHLDKSNRLPQQAQQESLQKVSKVAEKQNQQQIQQQIQQPSKAPISNGSTGLNQFAQQIQKIQQKDKLQIQQQPVQNFDQKFISRDLKLQQQEQQQQYEQDEQENFYQNGNEEEEELDYDLRANEDEDSQQAFSNQLYQQIKTEQKYNIEQKIQKLNVEQMQKQQQQNQQQYSKQYANSVQQEDFYETNAGHSTAVVDHSHSVSVQKNSEKTDKNASSVRPLQNVNLYEPPEDNSNRKKSNSQKFIILNNNNNTNSNFSTNSNFTTNGNFVNQFANNLTNSNFQTSQQNQQNSENTQQILVNSQNGGVFENQKFKLPQHTNQQHSFNSSMNEDKLNPVSSVLTGERSIDQALQKQDKYSKRNSQQQVISDEQISQQIPQQKQPNEPKQVISQNIQNQKLLQTDQQLFQRKNTMENKPSSNAQTHQGGHSKSTPQDVYDSTYEKKRNSQASSNQMNLDQSNSMNEQPSQSDIINKSKMRQDQHQSYDSQQSHGQQYNKYDLPMKQIPQQQLQREQEAQQQVIKSSNNSKRDPSPQIVQQKQHQPKTVVNNNQQIPVNQNQFQNDDNIKRSGKISQDSRYHQYQQEEQDEVNEVQQNDYSQNVQNEEDPESMDFKFQPYCDEHPYEELGFFNFSQNKCICLKCLQKGDFITEDVTNFEKGQELLLEKVDDCNRQINVCIELLKLSSKRLEDKHRKRVEKTNQAKIMITEQLQLIMQKLEEKQNQLLLEADDILLTSENMLNNKAEQHQHKLKILAQLRHHFSEINQNSIQPNAKTFKEFQFCRSILDQFLYENDEDLQLANHNNVSGSPNSSASKNVASNYIMNNQLLQQSQQEIVNNFNIDELSHFVEQIQFFKNKITDIRGVELGTHNSSLRNSFSNNLNTKNQQIITNSNITNLNNTSSKLLNQNPYANSAQVQSFVNEDSSTTAAMNQQAYKEPKPYYKSSDKSSRRLSSSQKQGIVQGQQQQQNQYSQIAQNEQNVHFSPIEQQQYPQIAESYQMNQPNAFEIEDQTVSLNQLFQQQQQLQSQIQAQFANQFSSQKPANPAKKKINDQIQYVMGSNPFEKDRVKDTNSTFSSQNLTYLNNNNNSLNFANAISQKFNPQFLTNVNSPASQQQQMFSNSSISYQNLIKSQSQKNLYEQQQQMNQQFPNQAFVSQDQINNNNPFSPGFNNSNYQNASNNNEFIDKKQQKTDPGNIAANNNAYRQFQNNKLQQQHLMQFNEILNNHLGNGQPNHNPNNLMMMNSHGMSLLEGGVSHHLASTSEASRNIQLIDDQFTNFKNNLAEEFNNSLDSHTLKRPSQPSTSASKTGQQAIDLFRKTNSVANILSTNTHQSPSRYALLKGSGSNTKIGSTISATLPKSNEYYNRSSFVSNYYNSKLDRGSFSTTGVNSNNNSNTNIKAGGTHTTFSHRIPNNDILSTIPLPAHHNSLLTKKRQSQMLRAHFNSNQNNSQNNLNNFSSELKNSFCETGSINNSGNRYHTKKSEVSYINNTANANAFMTNNPQQLFSVPHNTSFSKSKQASHGNLNSFYNNNNNNNTSMNTNNVTNNNNNMNTLASDLNHNISFQGTSGKIYNIKNQNTLDQKNLGFINKSLKKYSDLFRRQKKIMFENENN